MKLKYIGRHEAVEVDLPDGGGFTVERGKETPELPDDIAASLLEQEANWQPFDTKAKDTKPTPSAGDTTQQEATN